MGRRGKKRSRKQLEQESPEDENYDSDKMFEVDSDAEEADEIFFGAQDSDDSDEEPDVEFQEDGTVRNLPEFQRLLEERERYRNAIRQELGEDGNEDNENEEEKDEAGISTVEAIEANHQDASDTSEIDDDFDLKNSNRFEWQEEEKEEHLPIEQLVQEASEKGSNRKRKVLILGTRGIDARHRHLMTDLKKLIPHSKSGAKFNPKESREQLVRLAHASGCNTILFFEEFHGQLFIWLAMSPAGPSIRFLVENIHTMAELKLTGNCLQYSRPMLHFDTHFDATPLTQLTKGMLTQTFSTPKGHLKSKPFIDHILSFYLLDNRIWFRNYQLVERFQGRKPSERSLVEIGPRFVLRPVSVLEGAFSGKQLFENPFITFAMKAKRQEQVQKRETKEVNMKKKAKRSKYLDKTQKLMFDEVNNVFFE